MLRYLLKYKLAKIVPMEVSFFHSTILPKNIKLSAELVTLNYEKLSPFEKPFIVTYREEKQLYIWFTKSSIISEELFVIPEAFLLFLLLKKEKDGIYLFKTNPQKIIVIKNGFLKASFVSQDKVFIDILENEYQLSTSTILEEKTFEEKKEEAISNFSFYDLYQFSKLSLNKQEIKEFITEKLTYPIVSLVVIYILISYSQSYIMEKKIDKLTSDYIELKNQNTELKQAIHKHNKEVREYQEFIDSELKSSVDVFKAIYDFYKIITPKDKAIVKSVYITENDIRLLIETKDGAIKYLNRLNKIPYFKSVVIQNTRKNKKGLETITYYIEMRKK